MAKKIKPIKLKNLLLGEVAGTRKEVILSTECIELLKKRAKAAEMLLKPFLENLLIQAAARPIKDFKKDDLKNNVC